MEHERGHGGAAHRIDAAARGSAAADLDGCPHLAADIGGKEGFEVALVAAGDEDRFFLLEDGGTGDAAGAIEAYEDVELRS